MTAIEFAILAPVMFTLIIGAVEFGHLMTARMSLEGGLHEAARAALADLRTSEDDRDVKMRAYVARHMSAYRLADGRALTIGTTVFHSLGSASPEPYQDLNGNKQYDPPGAEPGEPFTDRNRNGVRDLTAPVTGKLGNPGDVVAYTATYPLKLYFPLMEDLLGLRDGFTVTANVVSRNEPIAGSSTAT